MLHVHFAVPAIQMPPCVLVGKRRQPPAIVVTVYKLSYTACVQNACIYLTQALLMHMVQPGYFKSGPGYFKSPFLQTPCPC